MTFTKEVGGRLRFNFNRLNILLPMVKDCQRNFSAFQAASNICIVQIPSYIHTHLVGNYILAEEGYLFCIPQLSSQRNSAIHDVIIHPKCFTVLIKSC